MFSATSLRLCVLLLLLVSLILCEKASPKPGLKRFREDYKSITETCLDVGFIKKCTSKAAAAVAFDVRLRDNKRNLGTGSKVVFATVNLNEGLGYDASSGVFTAPFHGIYAFQWTILAWQGKYAYTSLFVNGSGTSSKNYCNDGGSKTWLPCSMMAVKKLKQGDKVWIGIWSGQADIHNIYTSFSGYRL